MKRLLITGGAGFIGSNFVRYMAEAYPDYTLVVVDKLTYAGDKERLAGLEKQITFHQADIGDHDKMDELIRDTDWIVHFAAETHVDRSIADPGPFIATNILGTDTLARLAIKHKVERFHHVSTDEVFGSLELTSDTKFNEQTPYNPRSPYAASKASSDHLIRAYGETYGLPFTITNCSNNYGPYDSPGRAIPVFITKALESKNLPVYGNGQAVRDYLFVEDHCRAIDLVLHKGATGSTYCIGGASQVDGTQLASNILEQLSKPLSLIEYVADRPGHDQRYDIDSSRIQTELGWQPSVTFKDGIGKTIEWYKTHEVWWKAYQQRIDLQRDSELNTSKGAAQ